MTRSKLTVEQCKETAKRFSTRTAWARAHPHPYRVARENGWLKTCCAHMGEPLVKPKNHWTLATCRSVALGYTSRKKWKTGHGSSYKAAVTNGWMEACCVHMLASTRPRGHWNLANCKAEAFQYTSRSDWERGSKSSYTVATRRGWLEECSVHMPPREGATSADVFYVWRAEGCTFNGEQVYKFGVTSRRLGLSRIDKVAAAAGVKPTVVIYAEGVDAFSLERAARAHGANPPS